MKKNILIVPCNNGLGHIVRCVILANYLVKYYDVTLIIDKNKKKKFLIKKQIKLIYQTLRNNISIQKKYFFEKRLNISFNNYDLILSDNLVEPIFKNKKTMLLGNFFWHDIIVNQKFKRIFSNIIKIGNIKLFRNYLFAYKNYNNSYSIPFFGKFRIKHKSSRENILISLGTADLQRKKIIFNHILSALKKFNLPVVYLDKDLYNFIIKKNKDKKFKQHIAVAKYDKKMFEEVSVALIKPGFGIIRDCLSNSIKMIIPKMKYNKEFLHNSKILQINNLGIQFETFEKSLEYSINYIKNIYEKKKYFNICKKLKWNAEETIYKEVKKFFLKY